MSLHVYCHRFLLILDVSYRHAQLLFCAKSICWHREHQTVSNQHQYSVCHVLTNCIGMV